MMNDTKQNCLAYFIEEYLRFQCRVDRNYTLVSLIVSNAVNHHPLNLQK